MFSSNSSQVSDDKLFVEDAFSTFVYTGNGSTQTITNGIDLAGKGGLVWMKSRSTAGDHHVLTDTVTGATKQLASNLTDQQYTYSGFGLTSFGSTGFTLTDNSTGSYYVNGSSKTYASWTFRKAPKFFDVVTYTGNGADARAIAHSLGSTPGCIIIKKTSDTGNWVVNHRSLNSGTGNGSLFLNTTDPYDNSGSFYFGNRGTGTYIAPTSTQFTVSYSSDVNASGATYVAYLFAHDTTSDGIIQCGSFTTDGSGNATVNLGWEPQWVLTKPTSTTGNWVISDTMRGYSQSATQWLYPNTSGAEAGAGPIGGVNATGFKFDGIYAAGTTVAYIAIRRGPMRTPTSGTSVYENVAYSGNGASNRQIGTSVLLDMMLLSDRTANSSGPYSTTYAHYIFDRLRGDNVSLQTSRTVAEVGGWNPYFDIDMNAGWDTGATVDQGYLNNSSSNYVSHVFRRAPSFFDVVCYTGTGTNNTISHNLGVQPELIIIKRRNAADNWPVWSKNASSSNLANGKTYLNQNAEYYTGDTMWSSAPTATQLNISTSLAELNASGGTYVAYLFASCPGVSKVGSYTGNGSSQTINCGFAAGARFVMIKRTDSTGDWYVWNSATGIVSGNDPHVSLNNGNAEVTTDDSVDTDSSGFVVNQLSATNINVNAATYLYMAVA